MSRTLRSPMVRGSTVLLGLGVLLWLLLRAPVSAPHHGIQAYAPFQVLARHLQEPSGLAWAESEHRPPLSSNPESCSVLRAPDATLPPLYLLAQTRQGDTQPPVLTLTEPAEGAIVTTPMIPVRGTLTVAGPITAREEHRKLPVTAGAFSATASLQWKGLKGII